LDKSETVTDTTIQNPNPNAGVPFDPLELPSDSQLLLRVLKPAISTAATSILLGVQKDFAKHFLEEGARLQEAKDMDGALEMLVKFMLCTPPTGGNTKEVETVTAWLMKCSGLDALPGTFPDDYCFAGLSARGGPDGSVSVFGARIQSMTEDLRKSLAFTGSGGFVVTMTEKGSPAEKAGLRWGDIITEVDSKPVNDAGLLMKETGRGGKHALSVLRMGQLMKLEIEGAGRGRRFLAAAQTSPTPTSPQLRDPASPSVSPVRRNDTPKPASRFAQLLGVRLEDAAIVRTAGIETGDGVFISRVDEGGVGKAAGLRWGDVITSVDGTAVRSVSDLDRVSPPPRGRPLRLSILRNKSESTVDVRVSP
jgi:hypothetical protein